MQRHYIYILEVRFCLGHLSAKLPPKCYACAHSTMPASYHRSTRAVHLLPPKSIFLSACVCVSVYVCMCVCEWGVCVCVCGVRVCVSVYGGGYRPTFFPERLHTSTFGLRCFPLFFSFLSFFALGSICCLGNKTQRQSL